MKKLVAVLSFVLSVPSYAEFDQARFDKDTAYYNEHKADAQAIITLLSVFNADNDGLRKAFENRANGDAEQWRKLVGRVNKARDYGDKLEVFMHFQSCKNAVSQANLLWTSAASMVNDFSEWDNPESFRLKQYQEARKSFRTNYANCKDEVKSPPQKEKYN